ncbi:ras-related protein Rab-24-like isoform X3 [Argiope bruennichi]|uniref:ras-related protein Rab-24-like isoform X3 n=1 Tax=Argiope bruennichi TaxID=94029 RepID=UPI002495931A|nr:ras-related protein Rab-24-like isoform X3 [Argiope bruennichi]
MSKVDIKIVLLGREFSGKTSLVERFVYNQFAGENLYQNDTAGSERYESIGKIYYRNSNAAIVCFDLTDVISFERAKFWVSELLKSEEKCRLYLCGTKKDLINKNRKRAVDYYNVTDYADEVNAEVFETSSKTGEGVEELFLKIGENFLKEKVVDTNESRNGFGVFSMEVEKKKECCF